MWSFWLALLLAVCFQNETSGSRIPFTRHEHGMVLQAYINGKGPVPLLVDTGAAVTVLSPAAAQQAGLTAQGLVHLAGVSGQPLTARIARAKTVRLGGATARNIEVVVRPVSFLNKQGIAGLLGQDFLEQFTMTVDHTHRVLTLALPTPKSKASRPEAVPVMELKAREVFAEPTQPFEAIDQLYPALNDAYEILAAGGKLKPQAITRLLGEVKSLESDLSELHQYLLNKAYPDQNAQVTNHVQKFLYCYPAHARNVSAIKRFLNGMASDSVNLQTAWEQIEATRVPMGHCR